MPKRKSPRASMSTTEIEAVHVAAAPSSTARSHCGILTRGGLLFSSVKLRSCMSVSGTSPTGSSMSGPPLCQTFRPNRSSTCS